MYALAIAELHPEDYIYIYMHFMFIEITRNNRIERQQLSYRTSVSAIDIAHVNTS